VKNLLHSPRAASTCRSYVSRKGKHIQHALRSLVIQHGPSSRVLTAMLIEIAMVATPFLAAAGGPQRLLLPAHVPCALPFLRAFRARSIGIPKEFLCTHRTASFVFPKYRNLTAFLHSCACAPPAKSTQQAMGRRRRRHTAHPTRARALTPPSGPSFQPMLPGRHLAPAPRRACFQSRSFQAR